VVGLAALDKHASTAAAAARQNMITGGKLARIHNALQARAENM
jgi:hypothetical protein